MRKIDFQKSTADFKKQVTDLKSFLSESKIAFSGNKNRDSYISNCYEYGIISLYKIFETFIYRTIVGCINHDSSHVSETYNLNFGKHISDEMCDFILTKGKYFNFSGRSDLISICKKHIGDTYGVVDILKNRNYESALDELIAFRNFAAHSSKQAKTKAKEVIKGQRIPSIGSYLKKQARLEKIADALCNLSDDVAAATRQ